MNSLLEHDHEELGGVLRDLFAALDGSDAGESLRWLDLFWARLGVHIRAEHLWLFPAILHELNSGRKAPGGDAPSLDDAQRTIAKLRTDHNFFMRELAGAIKQLRGPRVVTDSSSATDLLKVIRGRIAVISRRLDAHNKIEEEQVYRWPNQLLSSREQARLAAKLRREIENLPPRYLNAGRIE